MDNDDLEKMFSQANDSISKEDQERIAKELEEHQQKIQSKTPEEKARECAVCSNEKLEGGDYCSLCQSMIDSYTDDEKYSDEE